MWKYRSYYEFVTVNAFVSIGLDFQVAEFPSQKTMLEELKEVCGHVFRAIKLLKLPHFEINLLKVFLKFSLEIFSTKQKRNKQTQRSFLAFFSGKIAKLAQNCQNYIKELTKTSKTV